VTCQSFSDHWGGGGAGGGSQRQSENCDGNVQPPGGRPRWTKRFSKRCSTTNTTESLGHLCFPLFVTATVTISNWLQRLEGCRSYWDGGGAWVTTHQYEGLFGITWTREHVSASRCVFGPKQLVVMGLVSSVGKCCDCTQYPRSRCWCACANSCAMVSPDKGWVGGRC